MLEIKFHKNRNQGADFEVLYREHYSQVYRIVLAIAQNEAITEDAVQEAFYKAFVKLEQLKDKGKFSNWVTAIAINEAKDALRNVTTQKNRIIPFQEHHSHASSDRGFSNVDNRDEVGRILPLLKPHYRELLVLKYYSDFSIEEIASMMNESVSSVKIKIHRARLKFKKIYEANSEREEELGGE